MSAKRGGRKRPAGGYNPDGAGEGYGKKIKQEDTEAQTGQADKRANVVKETKHEHERLAKLYGEGVINFTTMKNQTHKLAYFCQICQVQLNSRSNLKMHAKGGKHKQCMVLFESGDLTIGDYYEEQEEPLNNWEKKAAKKLNRNKGWNKGDKNWNYDESGQDWQYGEGEQDWEYMEGGQIRDLRELVQGNVRGKSGRGKGRGKPGRGRGRGKPGRGENERQVDQDWDYEEPSHDEGEKEEGRGVDKFSQDDLTVREKLVHIRDMLLQSEELKPYVQDHGSSSNRRRRPSDRNLADPYLKGRYSPPEPNISSHHDDEPPYVPRPRDDPPYVPRPRDEPPYVPRPRDEPPYVPRRRDEPSFVPHRRDEPSISSRPHEEGPYVPRHRDGPPYVPHPDDELPSLRPFPRPGGAPYVDSGRPIPPLSTQSEDAAKTFALLKTLDGYKLNDDYDADTASVALRTLVNSIKFFINSSSVADPSVQVKLKQILDETGGKLETLRSLLREESTQSNAAMTVQPNIGSLDQASKSSYSRGLYPSQAPQKPYYSPFL